jgi:cystathionine gamma-lyase
VTLMKFSTKAIHAGQPSEPETGALVAPIFQTSTYEQESPGHDKGFSYSRTNNPTRQRLEGVLAELENVPHAAAFASGLAAENAILQAYLRPGDEVVIPEDVYGGTYRILNKVFQPIGVVVRQIDTGDLAAVESATTPKTRFVWIESPTNPRLLITDIVAVSKIAHARGALVVVDNTFATPVFQQPFELGADIVVHSVTKYLAGHSDTIQGAVLAKDAAVFEPIKFLQNATGAVPSPFDCWLTLRGLKTLDIARRQMTGFGGMVSFELDGSMDEVIAFASSRRYFALAESLGGVKALICHPATMTHASIPAEARAQLGLSDSLLRLSPGCENAEDLVEDLLEGLTELERARSSRKPVGATAR